MVSTGILLFLATLIVTIFIGRICECVLLKYRNRQRNNPVSRQSQKKAVSYRPASAYPNLHTEDS